MSVYRENAAPKYEERRATVWSLAPWASSVPRVVASAIAMLGSSLVGVRKYLRQRAGCCD